jgi:excisionase family DNA binding protein
MDQPVLGEDAPRQMLSVEQAAALIRVSRSTAYRMVRAGVIAADATPSHTGNRRTLRIAKAEVCRYLTSLKEQARRLSR